MYQGEVLVPEEELQEFSNAVDALKIKGNLFRQYQKNPKRIYAYLFHVFNNFIGLIFDETDGEELSTLKKKYCNKYNTIHEENEPNQIKEADDCFDVTDSILLKLNSGALDNVSLNDSSSIQAGNHFLIYPLSFVHD